MKDVIYLVTGAAGFLGSNICAQLLERGDRVRAFVLEGDKAAQYIKYSMAISVISPLWSPSLRSRRE